VLKPTLPLLLALITRALAADCIHVDGKSEVTLSGTLTFSVFPGPPQYEDVTQGDSPEPAYILELDEASCFTGDENFPQGEVSRAHLIVTGDDHQQFWQELKILIGRHVRASGREPFAAITGHHHAPVVMAIDQITAEHEDALWYQGTPATTVMAFYEALEVGQGGVAAQFVVPDKRRSGPLSADALTAFYANLRTPLDFIDLTPLAENQYEALYTYETANGRFCNGHTVVTTTRIEDRNLIAEIEAKNGC
jgi:hypothetical protein